MPQRYLMPIVVLFLSLAAQAEERYPVDRYSAYSLQPTRAQTDLLSQVVDVPFDQTINSVGQAIHYLLSRSGYRLAGGSAADPKLSALLDNRLPDAHRSLGPMTLRDALSTLGGRGWLLVTDPVNRLISFEVAKPLRG